MQCAFFFIIRYNKININNMDPNQTIAIRTRFEAFMRSLITPEISYMIDHYINTKNTEGHVMFKYGGRAWRNVVSPLVPIATMSPFEHACFLEGNYDLMLFPNSKISLTSVIDFFQTVIQQAIVIRFEAMHTEGYPGLINHSKKRIYKLRTYIESEDKQRTISNGFAYHLVLEVINPEIKGHELTVGDNPDRSILYFEISNNLLKDIELFRHIAISRRERTFLSPIGLLLVSSLLLVDREVEKGMSVDSVRNDYMERVIIPSIMANDTGPAFGREIASIENLYNILFIRSFNIIFNLDGPVTLYKNAQSVIMQKAFKTYRTTVTMPDHTQLAYNTFMEQYNTRLLDSPCGGNTHMPDMPSFRILINWMLIMFGVSGNDTYRFEKSGGDAIRFYLPTEITSTTDIDTKLFYSGTEKKTIQNKILLVVMVLLIFMEKSGYFRIDPFIIIVTFGNSQYKITFDTTSQLHLLSCRFLPYFMVPLISIDVRIKCNVEYELALPGFITDEPPIVLGWHYTNPILDVAFNHATQEDIRSKKLIRRVTFDQLPKENLTSLPMDDTGWLLTPIPTIEYLIADIEKIHADQHLLAARTKAGKVEKDKRRIRLLRAAEPNVENSMEVMSTLDQLIPVNEHYNSIKTRLLTIMYKLFNLSGGLLNVAIFKKKMDLIQAFFDSFKFDQDDKVGSNVMLYTVFLSEDKEIKRKLTFSVEKRAAIIDKIIAKLHDLQAAQERQETEAEDRLSSLRKRRVTEAEDRSSSRIKGGTRNKKNRTHTRKRKQNKQKTIRH